MSARSCCIPASVPEYRNAHGCFWALVNRDLDRVGMTLLRVDAGIDTGPVYLHGTCDIDEVRESHIVIQHRAVIENLDAIGRILLALCRGEDVPADRHRGRRSATWGQPRLTDYLRWKLAARRAATRRAPSEVAALMRAISLLFHDVYATDPRESGFASDAADRYKLSARAQFDAQLDADLPRRARRHPPFLITVDDGGVSYYTMMADRLEARGWRGHCFVSTDQIGTRGFLDAAQIRELDARGHVIGSHSASHPDPLQRLHARTDAAGMDAQPPGARRHPRPRRHGRVRAWRLLLEGRGARRPARPGCACSSPRSRSRPSTSEDGCTDRRADSPSAAAIRRTTSRAASAAVALGALGRVGELEREGAGQAAARTGVHARGRLVAGHE